MKKITLVSLVYIYLLPAKLFCQNIDETVTYINALLKASSWQPSKNYIGYNQININEHGKIEITGFQENLEHKMEKIPFMIFAYLNELKLNKGATGTEIYWLYLYCNGLNGSFRKKCFSGDDGRDHFEFDISNSNDRDKLYNAFSHLLELAKENKNFYEKDPFGN